VNLCTSCGKDFGSLRAFDDHRVGRHDALFSGAALDGRRRLDEEELRAHGFVVNTRGRWSTSGFVGVDGVA
jgi:hypothetical protein